MPSRKNVKVEACVRNVWAEKTKELLCVWRLDHVFKMKKVFDCQDMPEDIRKMIFSIFEKNNDCYVDWQVEDSIWTEGEGVQEQAIDKWLIDNGAEGHKGPGMPGETVLIKYWW